MFLNNIVIFIIYCVYLDDFSFVLNMIRFVVNMRDRDMIKLVLFRKDVFLKCWCILGNCFFVLVVVVDMFLILLIDIVC